MYITSNCNFTIIIISLLKVGPPVAEQHIQPMEVMVTASAQRSPPKILKNLQDTEVVEGEK
jgi:hypothetical protein